MRSYLLITIRRGGTLWCVALCGLLALVGCSPRVVQPSHEIDSALGALFHIHQQRIRTGHWPAGAIDSAIARYPQEGEFYYQRGQMLLEHEQYAEAVSAFEQASLLDSGNTVYLTAYGEALAGSDVPGDSTTLRLAKRLVRLQERKPEAWYRLALEYLRLGQPDSAIAICHQQGAMMAPFYSINLLIASAFHQKGECDSMYYYAERAVERGEQLENALYFAAQAAMMCDKQVELVEAFERAAQHAPPDAQAWRIYTDYLCRRGAEHQAVRTFLKIAEQHPAQQEQTLEVLSLLLYAARGTTLAHEDYAAAFARIFQRLAPTKPALVLQYRFYMVTRQPMHGYETVRHLSDAEPEAYFLWNLRRQIEMAQLRDSVEGSWERLAATLRFMSEAFPFDASSALQYSLLGRLGSLSTLRPDTLNRFIARYEQMLRQAKRGDVFTIRMEDSASVTIGKRGALRQSLSLLYATRGDLEAEAMQLREAWGSYEKALRLDTANAVACNNYAYSLAMHDRSRLALARKLSERSLRYEPKNVNYLDTYGYILYLGGHYEAARATFARLLAIERNPGRTALQHYSDVLRALGNTASAELYMMRAAESVRP